MDSREGAGLRVVTDGAVDEATGNTSDRFVYRRAGDVWRVVFDGNPEFHIADSLGARYLDWLLHRPGEMVSCFDLEKEVTPEKTMARNRDAFDFPLDPDAIRAYLREVEKLRSELDDATAKGDTAEVVRLEKEIETIEEQLKKQGRSKDTGERARDNVRQAINAVKRKLAKGDKCQKVFLQHIVEAVSTGYKCTYTQPLGRIWQ